MVTVNGNRVVFRFFRPGAAKVSLIGEFNNWREGELAMALDDDGHWQAVLYLSPGDHRFRYVADGQVFVDYAAFGVWPGPVGYDSVVFVDQVPGGLADPQGVIQSRLVRQNQDPAARAERQDALDIDEGETRWTPNRVDGKLPRRSQRQSQHRGVRGRIQVTG